MMTQQSVPGGHYCENCGGFVKCDKRLLGKGRQKPLHDYGANHASIHQILQHESGRSWTVRQLQGELDFHRVVHAGKRPAWNYVAVQAVVSDLVGWGFVSMERVPKSREWMYRFKAAKVILEGGPGAD